MSSALTPSETVVDVLSAFLGPHTAKTAVRTFSQRSLSMEPEALTAADALKLVEALRPTLGGLLGSAKAEEIVRNLISVLKG
jgi:hypothetical protein